MRDLISRFLNVPPADGSPLIAVGPAAAPWGAEACALAGYGLDLHRGEHVLAAVRLHQAPRGYQHLVAMALTNTRLILGGYASIKHDRNALGVAVAYDHMTEVTAEKSFIKGAKLDVHTAAGKISLLEVYRDALAEFFKALASVPVGARAEPGLDAVRPSADDPIGAATVRRELWAPDPVIDDVLARVQSASRQGAIETHQGQDLVGRCVVAHRGRLQAPGCYADGFASAPFAQDLSFILAQLLGAPIAEQQGPDGTLCVDFGVPNAQGLPPALAALGIASYFGLGVGFSPGRMIAHEMMSKPPLRSIRLVARDAFGGSCYSLFDGGTGRPLHDSEALWAHAIHQMLAHHGASALAQRVAAIPDTRS